MHDSSRIAQLYSTKILIKWPELIGKTKDNKLPVSLFWQYHNAVYSSMPKQTKWGALRDLAPYAQFKKREKHPSRSVAFSKVAGFSL